MSKENILERLNNVFRDVFDDDELLVTSATVSQDVDGWDSLRHITLLAAIEDEFGVVFSMADVKKFTCVGDIVEHLQEHAV